HDFGQATIADIYGPEKLNEALHLLAYNFKSGILRNEGQGQFSFIAFPEEAQLSSINAILPKDLDGDGQAELIMAGNLFTSEIETPRNDAGYGLVLQSKGKGEYAPISNAESGLFLPGDVKVLRWIEVNGKTVLIAGNNDGEVGLLKVEGQKLQ
ncbi:MAG: VCBS repeat-containing protein, partial [Bacteroidetes bacterium]|nr:VCBS repeat-containing protein [Bacteroidota bacterium]